MKNLKESIQHLLHLQRPLPKSLSDEVRVGNPSLLKIQEDFIDIAGELRIWSFYETIDSELSGSGSGHSSEVQFGAPLVSIKSALLELRHEDVFAVESDHAHLASFGPNNIGTMDTFLTDLTAAILKAHKLSAYIHTPLKLKDHVRVEVIGFYEDPDAEMDSAIRLYATRYLLSEFLVKGPEKCLAERLTKGNKRQSSQMKEDQVPGSSPGGGQVRGNTLGVRNSVQKMPHVPPTATPDPLHGPTQSGSPDIVVTSSSRRPSISLQGRGAPITVGIKGRSHGVSEPVLATINTRPPSAGSDSSTASTASEPALQHSSIDDASSPKSAEAREMDLIAKQREELLSLSKAHYIIQDPMAGFSRPDPNLRKFMWIHAPFTNPIWVRVREAEYSSETALVGLTECTEHIRQAQRDPKLQPV